MSGRVENIIGRVELAQRIASKLMLYPLNLPPGFDHEQYYKALEICFVTEILDELNKVAKAEWT